MFRVDLQAHQRGDGQTPGPLVLTLFELEGGPPTEGRTLKDLSNGI